MTNFVFLCLTADGTDYQPQLNPSNGTLSNDMREVCFNVMIEDDDLVEGMETLVVHFDVTDFEGSFSLEGKNDTVMTILDNDGMFMREGGREGCRVGWQGGKGRAEGRERWREGEKEEGREGGREGGGKGGREGGREGGRDGQMREGGRWKMGGREKGREGRKKRVDG